MASETKLTPAKLSALKNIDETPLKSGRFWRDLGVTPQTLATLENDGLIDAGYRPLMSETTILRRSWIITEHGREALSRNGGRDE